MKKLNNKNNFRLSPIWIYFVFFIIYIVITLLLYFKLWRSYFVQDEWYYFGLFNEYINHPLGFLIVAVQQFTQSKLYGIHFTPLYNSIFFLEYQLFGLKFQHYALLSMFMHAVTATSVAYLVYKFIKSYGISFLAGIYFVISYSHIEAVIWANTHLQTQLPTLFCIVAISFWLDGIRNRSKHMLFLSLVLLVVALLIKEIVLGIFGVLVLITFLYADRQWKLKSIKYLLIAFFTYLPFRILFPVLLRRLDASYEMSSSLPTGMFDLFPQTLRLFFYPIKAFIQQFIHPDTVIMIAKKIAVWNYPRLYGAGEKELSLTYLNFINSVGADLVMLILFIPIAILIMLFIRKLNLNKKGESIRIVLIALSFFIAAVIPLLAIVPWMLTLFTYVTFIESRHFYLISVGASIFLAIVIKELFISAKAIQNVKIKHFTFILFVLSVVLYLGREVFVSRSNIVRNINLGEERRIITDYIKAVHPDIEDRALFYITSNSQYFGFAKPMVPFQTNFGYTLLNMYYRNNQYDRRFFTSGYLIDKGIDAEGYKEINGKGLGYFIQGKSLLNALRKYSIPVNNIYSFHYDGTNRILSMKTNEVRLQILKELVLQTNQIPRTTFHYPSDALTILLDNDYQLIEQPYKMNTSIDISRNGQKIYTVILHRDKRAMNISKFLTQRKISGYIDKEFYFGNLMKRTVYIKNQNEIQYYFFHNPINYQIIEIQSSQPKLKYAEEFFIRLKFQ